MSRPVVEQKKSFDRSDLIKCSEGNLFFEDSPRLPSDGMLMLDRVPEISIAGGKYESGFVKGELDISPDNWFFKCHFNGDPVMPGCLALDGMWQLMGFWLSWQGYRGRGRALGGNVRFSGQVLDDAGKITYRVNIKKLLNRKILVLTGDGTVSAGDDNEIYQFDDLKLTLLPHLE